MNDYISLLPNTFLWVSETEGLLYNTDNSSHYKFGLNADIEAICNALTKLENLYTVSLPDNITADLRLFIDTIVDLKLGFVHQNPRLYTLPPYLKIQEEFQEFNYTPTGRCLHNLKEVSVYVGGTCDTNQYYIQSDYPVNSDSELSYEDIYTIVNHLIPKTVRDIKIILSNVDSYKTIHNILQCSPVENKRFTICLKPGDYQQWMSRNYYIPSDINIQLVGLPHDYDRVNIDNEIFCQILIKESNDIEILEKLTKSIKNYSVIPVFDGNNYDFFRQNVFITKEDICNSRLDKRLVFAHGVINLNKFGKFSILPDKKVYSNVLADPLGSIYDNIYMIINDEILNQRWWFETRSSEKCASCLYKYLCPSISIQENLMNINHICLE